MRGKKTVRIDLTGCKYYMEMFERIRTAFGIDDDFGRNRDALWVALHNRQRRGISGSDRR
ncbi:MAG: barstar family protein [Clostridia bacterium]|nr:barstar family protein [Clostridia bacterium]